MSHFDTPRRHIDTENSNVSTSFLCKYEDVNRATRLLLEGVTFSELPNEFSLDEKFFQLLNAIKETVQKDKEKRAANPILTKLRERSRQYYNQKSGDPNAHDHIQRSQTLLNVSPNEFSQQVYLIDQKMFVGSSEKGEKRHVKIPENHRTAKRENIIVNIHTHPARSPFSRGDVSLMLGNDHSLPQKCLFLLAAEDMLLAGVVGKDAKRKTLQELSDELQLRDSSFDYHDFIDQLAPELPKHISNDRQRQFALQFIDLLKISDNYGIGIYASTTPDSPSVFKRVTSPADVVSLSNSSQNI